MYVAQEDMRVVDLLITPGVPFALLAVVGVLLATMGLLRIEQTRRALVGVRTAPTPWSMTGRLVAGHVAAIPLAAVPLVSIISSDVRGPLRILLIGAAVATYLYVGIALPRRPITQAQQEARTLRRLTPALIAFLRVALASFESPASVLQRYVSRPTPRWALMQALVSEAIALMQDQRLRPFEALRRVARGRQCQELIDVTEHLAQAEADGSNVQETLAAQEATLLVILNDEFKRMLRRRTLYLLLLVAISLVIGILINLLFVMTGGGSVLTRVGF